MKLKRLFIFCILGLLFILCACGEEKYTVVEKVEVTVDYETYKATCSLSCEMTGNKDREYIKLVITSYGDNIFNNTTELYVNGEKVTANFTIDTTGHELVYKYLNPNYVEDPTKVINEVNFNLDTINYSSDTVNEAFTIKVEHDSNYTWITTTLTFNDGYKLGTNFTVSVNGKLVEKDYVINDERTELVYKIKDPNWTPTY